MRKLTVKNFSVIEDAELEFGKITVLIGPQASGKSLLCKLARFFDQIVSESLATSLYLNESFLAALQRAQNEFSNWFPNTGNKVGTWSAAFSDGEYWVRIGGMNRWDGVGSYSLELSPAIKDVFDRFPQEASSSSPLILNYASLHPREFLTNKLRELRSKDAPSVRSYIPSTRALYLILPPAPLTTSDKLDQTISRFAAEFSLDFEKRLPNIEHDRTLSDWIDSESFRLLKGRIEPIGSIGVFTASDGRSLALSQLSSGTQELVPLLTVLREFVARSSIQAAQHLNAKQPSKWSFFVEEPEMSIFPSTQDELVRIFARMSNEPVLDTSWVITTHSPYILTAFNNLIQAWRVGNKPGKHDEVAAVIPEQYWIDEKDFKAYAIHDGKLRPIFEVETEGKEGSGLIDGDYLDSVSDNLGSQFDKLLDIEYAK